MRGGRWLLVAWLGLAGCAHGPDPQPVSEKTPSWVPGSCKVFTGPTGVKVALVKPSLDEPDRVLMRITGTNAEIDGLVLRCRVQVNYTNHAYVTTLHGREKALLIMKYRGAEAGAVLNLLGHGQLKLSFAADKTETFDPAVLLRAHDRQRRAGMLQAIERFDRKREIEIQKKKLAEYVESLNEQSGESFEISVDWKSVPDQLLKEHTDLFRRCVTVLSVMTEISQHDPAAEAKKILGQSIQKIECRFGSGLDLQLEKGRLVFTTPPTQESKEMRRVRRYFLEEMPAGAGWTLQRRMDLAQTEICTNGAGHYVGVGAYPKGERTVLFGDGKTFTRVLPMRGFDGSSFFDPREEAEHAGGIPMLRYKSHLHTDLKTDACRLMCGRRKIDLNKLPGEKARELLLGASFLPPPPRRKPFALARDRRGVYYFIDTADREGARDFRLYRGRKGNLKQLEMTNIVEDSQGAIFSTRSGKLRLIVEKENSFWIDGEKTHALVNLSLVDNLGMIYNQLGPYLGKPFGTPCDIL